MPETVSDMDHGHTERLCHQGEQQFKEMLAAFPSSFDLNFEILTREKKQAEREQLLNKLKGKFIIVDEEIRLQNLVSYLSFLLGDTVKAYELNNKVLQKQNINVTALANRAWFDRKNGNFYQAQKGLEKLQNLAQNENMNVWEDTLKFARGENAIALASCGPKFYKMAVHAFESLLKNLPNNEEVIVMWNFEYGLCLKRTLNVFNSTTLPRDDVKRTMKRACTAFANVIQSSQLKTFQARAWCCLGELAYTVQHHPITYGHDLTRYIPPHCFTQTVLDYFEKAIHLDNEDFDVNLTCARYYHYHDKDNESVKHFEKALSIRQTSKAYHHYALTLKRIEKKRQEEKYSRKYDDLPSDEEEEVHRKLILKSTRYTKKLILTPEIEKVLHNFDRAIDIQYANYSAHYDKAYTLRQLRQPDHARQLLSDIASSLDCNELKISCLEQASFCCLDLEKGETDPSKKEAYKFDSICWIQNAIEVAAVVASKAGYWSTEFRPLIPTVKDLISDRNIINTQRREIKRLKRLLEKHHNKYAALERVRSDENVAVSAIIEECRKVGDNDEAAIVAILKTFTAEKDVDEYLEFMSIVLEEASKARSKKDLCHAKIRFQIWFELLKLRASTDKQTREYDLFLMTDFESENLRPMCKVATWLKDVCGLKIANSDDNCGVNKQTLRSLADYIEASFAVIAVFKNISREIEPALRTAINSLLSLPKDYRPKFLILKEEGVGLPTEWMSVNQMLLPPEFDSQDYGMISAWICQLLKTLLFVE